MEAYHLREDMGPLLKLKAKRRKSDGAPDLDKEPPVFKNGGELRDYQREVRILAPPKLRVVMMCRRRFPSHNSKNQSHGDANTTTVVSYGKQSRFFFFLLLLGGRLILPYHIIASLALSSMRRNRAGGSSMVDG